MNEIELEEIKREIVEGRSLTIKTNHLVNGLSADLRGLSKRLQAAERRGWAQSIAAYVVAVGLILGLSRLALNSQVEAVEAKNENKFARLTSLENEVELLRARSEAHAKAQREAAKVYEFIQSRQPRQLLEALPSLTNLELSPTERAIFEREGTKARRELSVQAYHRGVEHLERERYHEASESLAQALELEPDAPHAPQARYELARAYRGLGQYKSAIFVLMKLSEASRNADVMDEATWLLARSQADAELYNDAKATLRSFLRRFPRSPLRSRARKLLSQLNKSH
ncbi:MAG: tetratricopeptide repeat protein [Polyangiaceae bacterium]|nr:tetratricopeptide repeat protein [Polyangiaceae bacterium]